METQRGKVTWSGGRLPTEQGRRGLAVSMWGGRAPNTAVVSQAARGRGNPGLVWRGGYPDRCGREGSQELSPPQPAGGDGGRQKGPGPGGHPARRGCRQGGCRDAGGEERANPQGVGPHPPGCRAPVLRQGLPRHRLPCLRLPSQGQTLPGLSGHCGAGRAEGQVWSAHAQAPMSSSPAAVGLASRTRLRAGALRLCGG